MIGVVRFKVSETSTVYHYHGIYRPDEGEDVTCEHTHRKNGHALDCAQLLADRWHKEND